MTGGGTARGAEERGSENGLREEDDDSRGWQRLVRLELARMGWVDAVLLGFSNMAQM